MERVHLTTQRPTALRGAHVVTDEGEETAPADEVAFGQRPRHQEESWVEPREGFNPGGFEEIKRSREEA